MDRTPPRREVRKPPAAGPERAVEAFFALGVMSRWQLMRVLGRERVLTREGAARLAGVSELVAGRGFQMLLRAGLVVREAAGDDGRVWEYRLSDTGEALVQAGVLLEG